MKKCFGVQETSHGEHGKSFLATRHRLAPLTITLSIFTFATFITAAISSHLAPQSPSSATDKNTEVNLAVDTALSVSIIDFTDPSPVIPAISMS